MVVKVMALLQVNQVLLVDQVVVAHITDLRVKEHLVIVHLQAHHKEIQVELEMEDLLEDLLLDQEVVEEQLQQVQMEDVL